MKKLLLASIALCLTLPGCWPWAPAKKLTGLVIINVLEPEQYNDCHIKGSINIAPDKIATCANTVEKDAKVVVYCTNPMCTASDYARKELMKMGFKNVHAYEAGIAGWYQAKLPVEGPCNEGYLKMMVTEPEPAEGTISTRDLAAKMGVTAP